HPHPATGLRFRLAFGLARRHPSVRLAKVRKPLAAWSRQRHPDPAQGDEVSTRMSTQRRCQSSRWNVSSTWGWVGVDTSRETTCPLAPRYRPEPPVIGSVKFSDRLTIVPWVVICPPGRIEVVGHWASTLAALAVDTNVQT